jgi:hypothetical protein
MMSCAFNERIFLKPFREKKKNYYQFAHEVDLDYNDMLPLTEFFDNPAACTASKKKKSPSTI